MKLEIEIPDDLYNKMRLLCELLDEKIEKRITTILKEDILTIQEEIKKLL